MAMLFRNSLGRLSNAVLAKFFPVLAPVITLNAQDCWFWARTRSSKNWAAMCCFGRPISAVLYAQGYEYGSLLLNPPAASSQNRLQCDFSHLTSSDLLVLTTRPPLHDELVETKRAVKRSYSDLEEYVFTALRTCFEVCTREHVKLQRRLAQKLSDAYADRCDIEFTLHKWARYSRLKKYEIYDKWHKAPPPLRTAIYLVYLDALWDGGPGLLNVFGMGGPEGLLGAYLLRTRFPEYLRLDAPTFAIAEMTPEDIPCKAADLSFADTWQMDFILNVPL